MRNLLLSSATLLLVPAVSMAAPGFITYTHTDTPIELEPISDLSSSLKLAAVCFLGAGDCGDAGFNTVGGEDYTRPTSELCIEAGYATTSCVLPNYLYDRCPDNDAYYRSCREDKARACKEAGYVLSCDDGYILDNTQLCPYDSSYKKCKCNPCDGYAYTYAQATASGYVTDGSCSSCGTIYYKRKENPCSGFKTCDCGGEIGTNTCISGSITKYQTCKECCDSKYQYDSSNCPLPQELSGGSCGGKFEKCIMPLQYLYSDHSLSSEIIPSKTIVGIAVDPDNRLAVAVGYEKACWGGYGIDIPTLENTPWAGAGVYVKGERDSYQIRDGKENTQKILAYGKANNISYPAAEAANKYQPEGCASGSWCGAGNWYLPSNYQVFAYFDNRETILEMLEAINKLPDDWWYTRRDFYTITSNEIDDKQCGFIYINTGGMAGSSKQISVDQPDVILPFISY